MGMHPQQRRIQMEETNTLDEMITSLDDFEHVELSRLCIGPNDTLNQ